MSLCIALQAGISASSLSKSISSSHFVRSKAAEPRAVSVAISQGPADTAAFSVSNDQ